MSNKHKFKAVNYYQEPSFPICKKKFKMVKTIWIVYEKTYIIFWTADIVSERDLYNNLTYLPCMTATPFNAGLFYHRLNDS